MLALRDALARLQLDYLDIFVIHWPVAFPFVDATTFYPRTPEGTFLRDDGVTLEDTWRALQDARDAGLVRHIGVSNFLPRELDRVLAVASVAPAVNQVEAHPLLPRRPLLAACRMHGVAVQAYSPLGSSLARGPSLRTLPEVVAVAQARGCSAAEVLLRFALDRPDGPMQPIAKSETPAHIRANLQAASAAPLSSEHLQTLLGLRTRFRYVDPVWRDWQGEPLD